MKRLTTYIGIVAALVVAVVAVPLAQAADPSPAELKALEIRGQALNQLCEDSTLTGVGLPGPLRYHGCKQSADRVRAQGARDPRAGAERLVRWQLRRDLRVTLRSPRDRTGDPGHQVERLRLERLRHRCRGDARVRTPRRRDRRWCALRPQGQRVAAAGLVAPPRRDTGRGGFRPYRPGCLPASTPTLGSCQLLEPHVSDDRVEPEVVRAGSFRVRSSKEPLVIFDSLVEMQEISRSALLRMDRSCTAASRPPAR